MLGCQVTLLFLFTGKAGQKKEVLKTLFETTFGDKEVMKTDCPLYGDAGCPVFMGGIKKLIDFWPKRNIFKGNYCIL